MSERLDQSTPASLPPSDASESADGPVAVRQFVGFEVAGQTYAFPIEQIQEIVVLEQITRLPQVPDFIDGVSNLRGSIIPVVNLRGLMGYPQVDDRSTDRIVVVTVGDRIIGCRVDGVSQVNHFSDDQIQTPPDLVTPKGGQYLLGLVQRESEVIVLLNADELLEPSKLDAVHQSLTALRSGDNVP